MLDWHSCQICYPLEIKILLYSITARQIYGSEILSANDKK